MRRFYGFCALSGLCVRIRILRVKRLVRTYTSFAHLAFGAYVYRFFALRGLCVWIRLLDSLNVTVIRSWGFVDFFDVLMIWSWGSLICFICLTFVWLIVMDPLEDPSRGCDLLGSFANDLYILIGPSWGSFFWIPSISLFDVVHVIHRSNLTSDRLLLSNTITQCSNITVHYARSV